MGVSVCMSRKETDLFRGLGLQAFFDQALSRGGFQRLGPEPELFRMMNEG